MKLIKIILIGLLFYGVISGDALKGLSLKDIMSEEQPPTAGPTVDDQLYHYSDWRILVKERAAASSDLSDYCPPGYVYVGAITARLTAYEPSYRCCGSYADGKTSIGDNAWSMDGCAVDPRAIPYKTLIYIPEIGFREADDTGSAMKNSWDKGVYHIDIRMPFYCLAKKWGVKYKQVKLYKKL